MAILAYLAVTGDVQQRDTLATIFWPDSSQSLARGSLRRDLSVLNKALGGEWLDIERETVGLNQGGLSLDVAQFRQQLATCETHGHEPDVVCLACINPLTRAVELYRDDFLTGFTLPDCPEFDEWHFFQAEELREEFSSALQRLVKGHSTQGDYEEAVPFARRWLALDPLHEPAHRQLMWLYGRLHQPSAAIRQYNICKQVLQDELGVEPSEETTALVEKIKRARGKGQGGKEERGLATSNQQPATNLPVPATTFVGRVARLAEIEERLIDPDCRLLTLTGSGGVGKTRLAIQAAWRLVDAGGWQTLFADGVFFVRMAPTNGVGQMVTAVSNAINFNFYRDVDPKQQLLAYLREKEMLIVLDNFEHLIDEGADLVAEILATAPSVKLLVTSREALSLQEEWIIALAGMRYPSDGNFAHGLDGYSAIQLFMQNAKRIRPDFSLDNERDCVLQICQLVEGVPLALELAAAWLKVLPCAEIANGIERSFDLLTTTMRNVPERHRSMRVVFEQSWQMLAADEQAILQRLSIFRGGFRHQAAEQIAGASLMHLMGLVEKSLVKVWGNGRYLIHNLLRQFAAEKLAENPDKQTATQHKHSDYFITLLQEQEPLLKGKQQKTALEAIRLEIGNVRKAWEIAISQNQVEAIERGLNSLYEFYAISSRYQEGADKFQKTANQLAGQSVPESLIVKLTARLGAFHTALGVYGLARELLQKSLSSARRLQLQSEIAFSLDLLGNVIAVQGNSIEAGELYQESLEFSRKNGDQIGTANALYNLGWIAVGLGDYPTAKRHFIESLALNRTVENEVRIAHVLDSLGMTDFFLGEYITAEGYFRESLAIFRALGDQHGIARAMSGLGIVAWGVGGDQLIQAIKLIEESVSINRAIGHRLEVARRLGYLGAVANSMGDYESAQKSHTEALAIAQEIGFSFGVPWSFVGLGMAAAGLGEDQTAQMYFNEAIEIAIQAQNMPIVLDAVVSLAALKQKAGLFEEAVGMVTAVIQHPASWQIIKERATRLLTKLETEIDKTTFKQAQEHGKTTSIEDFVIDLLTEKSINLTQENLRRVHRERRGILFLFLPLSLSSFVPLY